MINLSMPEVHVDLRPRITVFGVGGAGGNAVNNMIKLNLEGVEFVVANTDAQALNGSLAQKRLQLGTTITRGLGAGSRPDVGRAAAEEQLEEILSFLDGSNMVFITAGMGGGTGTGAAPVIARAAREQSILTVGVVTKPFHFEGAHRMRLAEAGIAELQQYVDTLIIIPNQNLFRVANEKTTFADAFKMADDVLHSGVRGVTDLMVMPGLINLDFADIRSVMTEMGKAMMGTGEAGGDRRAIDAAEAAISNPLLDDVSMKGARGVLINITGGMDMTLFEVDEAANRIRDEVDPDANIIFGSTFDQSMDGTMRVSVVATGIESEQMAQPRPSQPATLSVVAGGRANIPAGSAPARAATGARGAAEAKPIDYHSTLVAAPIHPVNAGGAATARVAEFITQPEPTLHTAAPAQPVAAPELRPQAQPQPQPTESRAPEPARPAATAPRDQFIPPRPMDAGPRPQQFQTQPAAFATPAPSAAATGPRRQSLFTRVTGSFRRNAEPEQHQPAPQQPPQPPMRAPAFTAAPSAPQRPQAAAPQPAPEPAPAPRPAKPAAQSAEDLLEIPAFLRRQVN
ncbi:MAG: cell division protein FtsZ [Azospirillaceae bacterium]|nr:cell division protein FtsZ [Azospirillaceae bacterium]